MKKRERKHCIVCNKERGNCNIRGANYDRDFWKQIYLEKNKIKEIK